MASSLTYLTSSLPGIRGILKEKSDHFRVIEILPSVPNEGEHVSLRCTRENMTTQDVLKKLMALFSLKNKKAIGYAGLKDKEAKTTQSFSLPLGRTYSLKKAHEILTQSFPEIKIEALEKREKKIRLGELSGNYFEVLVTNLPDDRSLCMEKVQRIEALIKKEGFPNYFGPQRFGEKGDNGERGREILKGKKIQSPWLKTFLLSAYQSELFNKWLSSRLEEGYFTQLCKGDACFREGDGRPFLFKEEKDGGSTVSYTGPLFGKKMFWPTDLPLKKEEELWKGEGQTLEQLKDFPLYGARRFGRVNVSDLKVTPKEEGLLFEMTLPSGVFATSLLREFMKK